MRQLFILCLFSMCAGCSPAHTELKGHIVNYHGEVVRICLEGQAERRDTLKVDSLGNFVFVPQTQEQGQIYEISVKDHNPWIPVYIAGGDQVGVELTLQPDKQVTATFSGDRLAENEYLQAYNAVTNSRKWYSPEMSSLSFKAYREKVEEMKHDLQQQLEQVKDAGLCGQWAVRQHLMLQEQLAAYYWRNAYQRGEEEAPEDADYVAFVQSLDLDNPEECNSEILRNVISWTLAQDKEADQKEHDVLYLNTLDRLVSNPEIKNREATAYVLGKFQFFSGMGLDGMMERYNAICTNDSLRQAVNAEFAEYMRAYGNLMPGKVAPDFEMSDVNGKKCRLSDLKGKYLFIDFWATWCAPCREEIPHMAKLQEHFAGDSRIALVSISVDANVKTWKKFLEKEQPAWAQYVVDAENNAILDKEYRIFGIPHFTLLDPEGRFVQYSFARPSFPGCMEEIERIIDE